MPSSFTDGTTAVQPLVVDGWDSGRNVGNVVNAVVGGGVDVMLRPAAPRSGTLSAVFTSLAAALSLEAMLSAAAVLTFADSDAPQFAMSFVATDAIRVSRSDDPLLLDDGTEIFVWLVGFGFQQVA